jgi:hypothetical protein
MPAIAATDNHPILYVPGGGGNMMRSVANILVNYMGRMFNAMGHFMRLVAHIVVSMRNCTERHGNGHDGQIFFHHGYCPMESIRSSIILRQYFVRALARIYFQID